MTQERTLTQSPRQEAPMIHAHGDPTTGGASPLLQQAAGYANVARAARANCRHGADAEHELRRRGNRSGQ